MPSITIDTSQLTFPLVAVSRDGSGAGAGNSPWDGLVDGAAVPPPQVALPAGTGYRLRLGDGTTAAVTFDVREDGTLDFAPEHDAFLDGRGGHHLTVRGVPVTIDARALDHPLTPELPGAGRCPRTASTSCSCCPPRPTGCWSRRAPPSAPSPSPSHPTDRSSSP
ncbi:hypothetical protein ACFQ9H_05705 [Streptomyces sp. NPDC056517]|uniref:hypothetical protein n=1 Tax=Streptomyces sp. NPDC056517 TaxID=3345848 RepID=UPI00367746A4